MEMFISGAKPQTKRVKEREFKVPTLADAPGVEVLVDGVKVVKWEHGNRSTELTPDECERLKVCCGWKRVQKFKALQVKGLMSTKGRNQIIKHFKGKKGYSPSTIANIFRALSK